MTAASDVVEATFCYNDYRDLDLDEAPCVPEPSTDDDWAEIDELKAENEDDLGTVVLRNEDTEIAIVDALGATVANFCLGAVPDLVAKRHVVVRYFLTYGYLRLDTEGKDVLVSGDHVPTVHLPRAGLIPALVDVGRRFVAFFDRLHDGEDDWSNLRDSLHGALDEAEEALKGWDGT